MLDTGHFAVEDSLEEIAAHIKRFHTEQVAGRAAVGAPEPVGEHPVKVVSGQRRPAAGGDREGEEGHDLDLQGTGRGPRPLRKLNLDGDRQSDLTVHGGPDKAVYAYPSEYYALCARAAGARLRGTFGENLTTEGLLDDSVSIGDRLRVGSAEFVVTQPRMPCFKLGIRLGRPSS